MNKIMRVQESYTGDIVAIPDINAMSEAQREGKAPIRLLNSNREVYMINNKIVYADIIMKQQNDAQYNALKYKEGSKIHIKKKNRGKFTAAAKRAGMSVQQYASKVLNDPNASPQLKKRANFARNASKWKHEKGGKVKYIYNNVQGKEKLNPHSTHITPNINDDNIWWAKQVMEKRAKRNKNK